jgi:hypothetical protein
VSIDCAPVLVFRVLGQQVRRGHSTVDVVPRVAPVATGSSERTVPRSDGITLECDLETERSQAGRTPVILPNGKTNPRPPGESTCGGAVANRMPTIAP